MPPERDNGARGRCRGANGEAGRFVEGSPPVIGGAAELRFRGSGEGRKRRGRSGGHGASGDGRSGDLRTECGTERNVGGNGGDGGATVVFVA